MDEHCRSSTSFELDRAPASGVARSNDRAAHARSWSPIAEDTTSPRAPLIAEEQRRFQRPPELNRMQSAPASARAFEPQFWQSRLHSSSFVDPSYGAYAPSACQLGVGTAAYVGPMLETAKDDKCSLGIAGVGSDTNEQEHKLSNEEEEHGMPSKMAGASHPMPSLRYTVIEVPPWHVCLILGFQHYLTMLGSTVVIPALLVPAMGGNPHDHARVVQTIFFVSGINTLIQTTIGDRLPIIQGGSFSFLKPAFSVIAVVKATHTFETEHDRFVYTMRELQGSIIGSSLVVMAIGYSGAMGALLRFVSPVVVAPVVCMVGLSLYESGFSGVAGCVEQGLLAMLAVIMFSQVLKRVEVSLPHGILSRPPSASALLLPGGAAASASPGLSIPLAGAGSRMRLAIRGVRIFELFPLLWSILLCWSLAGILTAAGVYNNTSKERKQACRTDNMQAMSDAPWLYVPYPLQWGAPIFNPSSIVTMAAGALAAMIESTGDYYACARMCGAPVPPPYVISRGVGAEGLGCFMCGLFGTGNGTTSYAENIGAIGLTGVGSRRVVQAGAMIMLLLGVLGKFGGLFASMPSAIMSGVFCCVFGIIAAVGLGNLQFTDQNSSRNMLIVGFSLYMALSVPYYFESYTNAHGKGPIATSSQQFNDIANTVFSTPMCVALLLAFVMDNAISGTPAERGLTHWSAVVGKAALRKQGSGPELAEPGPGRSSLLCRRLGEGDGDGSDECESSGDDSDTDPAMDPRSDPRIKAVYDLPYYLQRFNEHFILPHRLAVNGYLRDATRAVRRQWRRWRRQLRSCCSLRGGAARPGRGHGNVARSDAPVRRSGDAVPGVDGVGGSSAMRVGDCSAEGEGVARA